MLDLDRPRGLRSILADGLGIYFRNLGPLLAIGAAVAVPAELIVPGLMGGRLFASYTPGGPSDPGLLVSTLIVLGLYVTPVSFIACLGALAALAKGLPVSVGGCLRSGIGALGAALGPIVASQLGILLGLVLLVVPGIYLAVRWAFVVPSVAIDGARGADAVRRSSSLVQGRWWRVLGSLLVIEGLASAPTLLASAIGHLAGRLSGLDAAALAGDALGDVLGAPLAGVMLGLLYFDLRRAGAGPDGATTA